MLRIGESKIISSNLMKSKNINFRLKQMITVHIIYVHIINVNKKIELLLINILNDLNVEDNDTESWPYYLCQINHLIYLIIIHQIVWFIYIFCCRVNITLWTGGTDISGTTSGVSTRLGVCVRLSPRVKKILRQT